MVTYAVTLALNYRNIIKITMLLKILELRLETNQTIC